MPNDEEREFRFWRRKPAARSERRIYASIYKVPVHYGAHEPRTEALRRKRAYSQSRAVRLVFCSKNTSNRQWRGTCELTDAAVAKKRCMLAQPAFYLCVQFKMPDCEEGFGHARTSDNQASAIVGDKGIYRQEGRSRVSVVVSAILRVPDNTLGIR